MRIPNANVFLTETLCCDHSFKSSRLGDWNGGYAIRFRWETKKVFQNTFEMPTFFLIETLFCDHSFKSSRQDDSNGGLPIGFSGELKKSYSK